MGEVVKMTQTVRPDVELLFKVYCTAAIRAQETRRIEDGLAAGRAWGQFLKAFECNDTANGK